MAESTGGEYAFLDLTSGAFDLTDRGVKGREAPGPLDGFVYTERGVYRPGEEVHLAALVRDNTGKAASLPVTVIVTRPDGVEHSRFTLTDAGLGGRELTLPLGASAMTGTWRAKLHADPKATRSRRSRSWSRTSCPSASTSSSSRRRLRCHPQEPQTIKAIGRYLYGPPAAGLAIEGDIVVKPSKQASRALPATSSGRPTRASSPCASRSTLAAVTDAKGNADIAVQPAAGAAHRAPARG